MSSTEPSRPPQHTSPAAYGISVFAGVLLATLGAFQVLQGLSAILKDNVFVTGINYVYEINLTTWGWVTLILGVIGLAVGIGILMGQWWAASAGIGIAVLSAIGQFAFLPYYPFWAMLLIGLDVVVMWALAKQLASA